MTKVPTHLIGKIHIHSLAVITSKIQRIKRTSISQEDPIKSVMAVDVKKWNLKERVFENICSTGWPLNQPITNTKGWMNVGLPAITEIIGSRKARKRHPADSWILKPVEINQECRLNLWNPLSISTKEKPTQLQHLIPANQRKRCLKADRKAESEFTEDHFYLKLLKGRYESQTTSLSGVFKRLKLESEEVR